MSRHIKITSRERIVVYDKDTKAPFWLEHLLGLILVGLIVIVGGMIVLSLTDWGRAALVWLGIALGLAMAVWLFIDPWRSWRRGEPTPVWAGEALSASGWTVMTLCLGAGIPYVFWRGVHALPEWAFAVPGAGAAVGTAIAILGLRLQISRPLPALDRTPRTARVMFHGDDAEGGQSLALRYRGHDGEDHNAELADLIDESWLGRFAPGTTWLIYAFRVRKLADTVVFLTEEHDDVWRNGYKLDGVRLGGESGPVRTGPGSPFFRADSTWVFES